MSRAKDRARAESGSVYRNGKVWAINAWNEDQAEKKRLADEAKAKADKELAELRRIMAQRKPLGIHR